MVLPLSSSGPYCGICDWIAFSCDTAVLPLSSSGLHCSLTYPMTPWIIQQEVLPPVDGWLHCALGLCRTPTRRPRRAPAVQRRAPLRREGLRRDLRRQRQVLTSFSGGLHWGYDMLTAHLIEVSEYSRCPSAGSIEARRGSPSTYATSSRTPRLAAGSITACRRRPCTEAASRALPAVQRRAPLRRLRLAR